MRFRTEAIVLNSRPFGEADLIVRFFTRDQGLKNAFAKSARKIRSRFGASFEPFTCLRLAVHGKEGANLPRIIQADILQSFQKLRDELPVLLLLSDSSRLLASLLHAGEAHPHKFELFRAMLSHQERSGHREMIDAAFRIKFLWMAGYGPRVDGCGRCARTYRGDYGLFYPSHGSLICRDCASTDAGSGLRLGKETLDFFEAARRRTFAQLETRVYEEPVLVETRRALDHFIAHLTGR